MFNKFSKIILVKNICSILYEPIRHICEIPAIVMNNGNELPIIGFATCSEAVGNEGDNTPVKQNKEKITKAVEWAMDAGYRHFDCSHLDENQKEIGEVLKKKLEMKTIARKDLFITGKLWNTFHDPVNVAPACQQTLKELNIDYLDMFLMHTPMGFQYSEELFPQKDGKVLSSDVDYICTWKAMEELVEKGMCKNIGISNFNMQQVKRLLKNCKIIPQTFQLELHPYMTQKNLIHYAKCHDICITAYAPVGPPDWIKVEEEKKLLNDYKIIELSEKYQRSAAQILLRFQVQCGNAVIPTSTEKKELADFLNIFDFELSPNDIKNIESLNHNLRYFQFKGFVSRIKIVSLKNISLEVQSSKKKTSLLVREPNGKKP